MIRCPTLDRAVPTGMTCDIKTFGALTELGRLSCPACGQVHIWSVMDAWLRDGAYRTGQLAPALATK